MECGGKENNIDPGLYDYSICEYDIDGELIYGKECILRLINAVKYRKGQKIFIKDNIDNDIEFLDLQIHFLDILDSSLNKIYIKMDEYIKYGGKEEDIKLNLYKCAIHECSNKVKLVYCRDCISRLIDAIEYKINKVLSNKNESE